MKKGDLLFYAVCLVLLLVGILFDKNITFALAQYRAPIVTEIMTWFSFFGTWFVVLIIMTSLFLWQEHKRKWIIPLWLSLGISAGIIYILKMLVARERPEVALAAFSSTDSSFPSGHTAAVFSTLAILDKEFPRLKWFWIIFAVIVAFSRLYLGVHYLTDVVVGAIIGYTTGLIVLKIKKKK